MNIENFKKSKSSNFLEPTKPVNPFVSDDDPAIRDAIERKALKEAAERLAYEASEAAKKDKAERDRNEIATNLAYLNDKNAANPLYEAERQALYEKRMLELAEKEAREKEMRDARRMTPDYQLKEAERQAREKERLRETEAYWASDAGKRDKEILYKMDLYAAQTNTIDPITTIINKKLEWCKRNVNSSLNTLVIAIIVLEM
jgi:hypothetical protein